MRKTLLLYYSLEGNTKFVAETAAAAADIDVERLVPVKEPPKEGFGKFFWGGKSVVMHETPALEQLKYSPDEYDALIVAFPVWAGSYPPAIASYFKEHPVKGKKCCIIACSAGGNAEKAFDKTVKLLDGNEIVDTLSLTDPAKDKEKNSVLITDFIKKNFGS